MKYSGVLAIAAVASLSAAASAQQHPDISGLWTRGGAANTLFRPPPSGPGPLMTLPGQNVPRQAGDYNSPLLQPWAKEVVRRQTDRVLGQDVALNTPQETCWPMGVPHILQLNFHTQIIDDGKQIVFLYERHNQRRIARLNASHPATVKPSWFGDSVARWEGDTLVVDTIGNHEKTWLDDSGHPHSDALRIIERFRRSSLGRMEIQITIDDPKAYTKPWSVTQQLAFQPDTELLEYICNENNKYFEIIPKAADR
jgi:hypothetical protein